MADDIREVDFKIANAPLTKLEAYFLVSKLKRMILSAMASMAANGNMSPEAQKGFQEAIDVGREIEPLLDDLIYPKGKETQNGR